MPVSAACQASGCRCSDIHTAVLANRALFSRKVPVLTACHHPSTAAPFALLALSGDYFSVSDLIEFQNLFVNYTKANNVSNIVGPEDQTNTGTEARSVVAV